MASLCLAKFIFLRLEYAYAMQMQWWNLHVMYVFVIWEIIKFFEIL